MPRPDPPPLDPDPFEDGLPTLEAARLVLRMPRRDEAEGVLHVFGDADLLAFWGHAPLPDLAAARAYLDDIYSGCEKRTLFQWAIAERSSDALMGTVTLWKWDRHNHHAEIGYIIRPEYQGRGLAAEAVGALLRFGFGTLGLHRVEADTDPRNAASIRLLERLGFRQEGLFRERWLVDGAWLDSAMFGLLHADFRDPGAAAG